MKIVATTVAVEKSVLSLGATLQRSKNVNIFSFSEQQGAVRDFSKRRL
jgi:hypothetical protein